MLPEMNVRFASRMAELPPYLFGLINKMKLEKQKAGHDVIDLGMGSPCDPAPEQVVDALCEAVRDPQIHRYPVAEGMDNLRREISGLYNRDYGAALDPESEIVCTIGSKEGISHLCLALVGQGDTVMVPAPSFPIHAYAPVIAGGRVIRIPVMDNQAFIRGVIAACEHTRPRPRLLIINYPHNPTGALADLDFFREIVRLARRFGFMIIHDFAYAKITFDGYRAPSFLEVEGAKKVGVEFGSFSKSYNMAGWRIGFCAGHKDIIRGLSQIKGYYDYGIFSAVQAGGIAALRDCGPDVTRQAGIYQYRRDVLCRELEGIGWKVDKPKAGMFLWVSIPEAYHQSGSMDFALQMIERANVVVAPGIGFGEEGEGRLRLALVENESRLRRAVERIKNLNHQLEPGDHPPEIALCA